MKWSQSQSKAIGARDVNLVVSAGAGSGKTAVLIERIVSLLDSDENLHVNHILVMTFTEAAAAEMRQRLGVALEQRVEQAIAGDDRAKARRFQQEIDLLWRAQISTIHSFCLQLLRDNLFSLDVSPDFRLLGGNEEEVRLSAQAKATIEQALADSSDGTVQRMMVHLRLADVRRLIDVVLRTYQLARSQASPSAWLEMAAAAYPETVVPFSDTRFFPVFQSLVSTRLEMSIRAFSTGVQRARMVPELQSYETWLQGALEIVQNARAYSGKDTFQVEWLVAELGRLDGLGSPRTSYKGREAEEVKDLRKDGKAEIDAILPILQRGEALLVQDLCNLSPHIRALVSIVKQLMVDVEIGKLKDNVMDFGDLEHVAYRLLQKRGSELTRVYETYRHVFVDEYQDTSPIQDAIVDLITEKRDNLFAVGDVKQSIYRFRMAEPGLFLNRYGEYQAGHGGDVIDLNENYRSRSEIVSFVNFVFTQLFSDVTTDFAYDEHARMVSKAIYPNHDTEAPMIEVQLMDRGSQLSRSDDTDSTDGGERTGADLDLTALEREAQFVATRLSDMLFHTPTEIWDKVEQRMRLLRPGDVAVLVRSGRGALNTILDALQTMSIPATANTSTGFYDALEVKWLLSVLSVIDNPRDDLALITTLRSPMFHFDETMLGEIRLAKRGSYWEALRACETASLKPVIESFNSQLQRWRRFSKSHVVAELLQYVMEDTGFLRYVDGMSRAAIRRANVEKLQTMAQQYDKDHHDAGLYGFLADWRAHDEANLDFGVGGEAKLDAVQVMTIHRSKGLEFPVVFLMDLGKQFRLTQDIVYLHRDLGFGAVEYNPATQQRWRTVASIACAEADRRATLAEEARILYVALTRARERLILVGSAKNLEHTVMRAMGAHDLSTGTLTQGWFLRAKSYMDWLLPIVLRHPSAVNLQRLLDGDIWDGHVLDTDGQIEVRLSNIDEVAVEGVKVEKGSLDVDFDEWLNQVSTKVPHADVVRIVSNDDYGAEALFAKVSATDMRRLHVGMQKLERPQSKRTSPVATSLLESPVFAQSSTITPREQGILFHAFMQRCAFPVGNSSQDVTREIARLVTLKQLRPEAVDAINVNDVLRFLKSDLGQRLQRANTVYREQPFFHRIDVTGEDGRVFPVVAQGVIDCLFEEDDAFIVIDYKTDRVDEGGVTKKAKEYEAQVATYLAALQPLTKSKPVRAYLYFVQAETAIEVPSMPLSHIFKQLMKQRRMQENN